MADDLVLPAPSPAALQEIAQRSVPTEVPRQIDPKDDWKLNPNKSGEDYDDCPRPTCGTRDVEPLYRKGEEVTVFCCPDCRATWKRDGEAAYEQNVAKGLGAFSEGKRTQAAAANRTYSMPSRRFRDQYERIFGHS